MNTCTESPSDVVTELPSDTELKFLRWFYQNADFGPAHEDVLMIMMQDYHAEDSENTIPPEYIDEIFEEEDENDR